MKVVAGLVSFAIVVSVGCTDVPATNPHDPSTPSGQQAPTSVHGVLQRPEGFEADLVAEAAVELRAHERPGKRAYTAIVEGNGGFVFAGVPSGPYTLHVSMRGFAVEPVDLRVPIGADVDVGDIALVAVSNAAIRGRARLEGDAETGHGGLLVEVSARRSPR